jgi:hypothetical protein
MKDRPTGVVSFVEVEVTRMILATAHILERTISVVGCIYQYPKPATEHSFESEPPHFTSLKHPAHRTSLTANLRSSLGNGPVRLAGSLQRTCDLKEQGDLPS